ncbi:MAG: tetratricopeptide repeat protein [Candidatus Omnitrophica bacterium]|nr:tetratricopeptide repeat protein [Candidatus Omnitrophota bacterium]
MGERFMKGSYEWMFSKKEIAYFAENLKEAFWIINKEDFSIMMNDPNNSCENAKKINSIRDKFYVAFRKDKKYLQLGEIYIEQGKYAKAKAMFKKAIEFNPNNEEAYFLIENLYNNKLIYNEIEKTK